MSFRCLHREARGLPAAGPEDGPLQQLEDELFEVLYSGEGPQQDGAARPDAHREWAKTLHAAFSALPSFQRLARQCRADAGSTAVAVETLLEELQPKLPQAPTVPEPAALRRAAGKGCTEALGAVAEAQELAQGLQGVGDGVSPGDRVGDGVAALKLLGRLRKDSRLRRRPRARWESPKGPDFGRLQHGEAVQTAAGTTVHPAQVLGPSRRGRKLVISGDTRPCPALVAAAKDADLLVHEATFSDDEQQRALETKHSTGREAGRVAMEAGVRRLVLTHVSSRYDVDPSRLLAEAREEYKGPAEVAYDGFSVELPLRE